MSISYPVDPESRWAILHVPSGHLVSRNRRWPRRDGGPIEGVDQELVFLRHVEDERPEYDHRTHTLESTEIVDIDNNELRVEYQTVKKSSEALAVAVEREEELRYLRHFTNRRELLLGRLMIGAVLNYIIHDQPPPKAVRDLADDYIAETTRLWQNRARAKQLLDALENGEDPDLDTGWVEP